MRTAPMPLAEASVSTVKGLEKSGRAKTGADINACFRVSKAY